MEIPTKMSNIGYIKNAQNIEQLNAALYKLKQLQCDTVHIEEEEDTERHGWKQFISQLKEGDVAVLLSFKNAFKSFNDLMFFLKLCSIKDIRIVSLYDTLDTSDELFPSHSTKNILSVVADMSLSTNKDNFDDYKAEMLSDKHKEKKLRKYRMVINMYNAGYSIKEIMYRTGYRGKSNIYRILHMYNVELEYPTMVRTKQDQTNIIQRNL